MDPTSNHDNICPSSTTPIVNGLRVLVVGLGRFGGGVGVTRWLAAQGAQVTVTDQADADSLSESLAAIADLHVSLRLGGHEGCDLASTDLVVINPAVYKNRSELFAEICHRKIPWTTEMNLFCERCPAPVIGITGSYGKSTTCAMLAAVLESNVAGDTATFAGVHLGGNIGRSLLTDLGKIRPTDIVVLEMSNAQLEDLPRISWSPAIAVITNLQPQHLDRHGAFEAYVSAKLNLVRAGGSANPVIVGHLHADAERMLMAVLQENPQRLVRVDSHDQPIDLAVRGRHNQDNAACVWTICQSIGVAESTIRTALREFRGLPHRLEFVRSIEGVQYINDSKSTAPAATVTAIEALIDLEPHVSVRAGLAVPEPRASARATPSVDGVDPTSLIVIVGGQRKNVSLAECAGVMARACRAVICYGQAGPAFAEAIRSAEDASPRQPFTVREVAELGEAVEIARQMARQGDTVLFSPGAPSFDQYVNFSERGRHFVELVNAMERSCDDYR